jgi:hypothetical protein
MFNLACFRITKGKADYVILRRERDTSRTMTGTSYSSQSLTSFTCQCGSWALAVKCQVVLRRKHRTESELQLCIHSHECKKQSWLPTLSVTRFIRRRMTGWLNSRSQTRHDLRRIIIIQFMYVQNLTATGQLQS